jgi:hypothetical protein
MRYMVHAIHGACDTWCMRYMVHAIHGGDHLKASETRDHLKASETRDMPSSAKLPVPTCNCVLLSNTAAACNQGVGRWMMLEVLCSSSKTSSMPSAASWISRSSSLFRLINATWPQTFGHNILQTYGGLHLGRYAATPPHPTPPHPTPHHTTPHHTTPHHTTPHHTTPHHTTPHHPWPPANIIVTSLELLCDISTKAVR